MHRPASAPGPTLELTEVDRFRNGGRCGCRTGCYWDVARRSTGTSSDGLRTRPRAAERRRRLAGLAVDSWAVDYGLLDADGALLGNPRHYRDARTDAVIAEVHRKVDPERLYQVTGLQFLPFNTLYQLAAEPGPRRPPGAAGPGPARLLADRRPGRRGDQRLHHRPARRPDRRLGAGAGRGARPAGRAAARGRRRPGEVLAPAHRGGPGRARSRPTTLLVTTVGSHDTASAVVGVPADDPRFGYISCGTWGLVGVELDAPVLTEDSRRGQLHQRARHRRHDPLPAQRDGAVAAVRVDAHLGAARAPASTSARPAGRGRGAAGRRPAHRPGRPGLPAAGRHAGADRPCLPGRRPSRSTAPARRWSCAASWTAWPPPSPAAIAAGRAAVRAAGRGDPPGRRGRAERAALPAHRGRRRPAAGGRAGRGDRAGQPAGPGAHTRGPRRRPGGAAGPGPRGAPRAPVPVFAYRTGLPTVGASPYLRSAQCYRVGVVEPRKVPAAA